MWDYIPETLIFKEQPKVKFLIRKRIFHKGWQVSSSSTQYDHWVLLGNYNTRYEAVVAAKQFIKD